MRKYAVLGGASAPSPAYERHFATGITRTRSRPPAQPTIRSLPQSTPPQQVPPAKITLSSEIISLLSQTTHALGHLATPGQYPLLTPDQRASARQQVLLTVQAVAKVVEMEHLDALARHQAAGGGAGFAEKERGTTTARTESGGEMETPREGDSRLASRPVAVERVLRD